MNDLVGVNNLSDELFDLLVIHLPDLVEANLVAFLETFELLLELLELASELLVVLSELDVFLFELLALVLEAFLGLG